MKGKFFSVLFALVLVVSLSLVMAAPVPAASPADTDVGFEFSLGHSSDTAEWSTDNASETGAMGAYSVMLEKSANAGTTYIEFIPVPGTKLSDLATIGDTNFWYWYEHGLSGGPGIELQFTMPDYDSSTGYGRVDVSVQAGAYGADNPSGVLLLNQWANENTIINNTAFYWGWEPVDGDVFHMDPGDGDYERATLSDMLDLIDAEAEMDGASAADWELTRVRIELYGAIARTCYIDDVTLDGVTYELEPIFLDAEYYSVGDTVEVTVPNFAANTDPFRVNPLAGEIPETPVEDNWSILVNSSSDPTTNIIVALEETGANTGVFTASFGTSGTTPVAADELYVQDGATITVTYAGSDPWWGDSDNSTEVTALVDDTPPTIDTLLPGDGTIEYTVTPIISATLSDGAGSGIDATTVRMTVNDVVVTHILVAGVVSYTPGAEEAFDAGDTVEVTVDVKDKAGNAADTASWSFTIASAFNVTAPAKIAAAEESSVEVTFSDVDGDGPDGLTVTEPLNTVKVSLSGPGVDLESGDFDGTGGEGDATVIDATSLTFAVTPEQAGTITVTFVGTFDAIEEADPVVITKTLDIDVTGFLVEETWADVERGTTGDISMTVTTKAGAKVNTGKVTITAPKPAGFEKNVDGVAGDESFTTIIINDPEGKITYDAGDPEDFVVIDGYYEVTGIKFVEVGAVDILVEDAAGNNKAHFTTAFTIKGVDVYEVLLDPATVTAGVETNVAVTVTDDGNPVTAIDSIELDSDELLGAATSGTGEYTITVSESEAGTPAVTVTGEGGQKYGTAVLTVALPSVVDYTIYEEVEGEQVERNVMLTGKAYTLDVTVDDALGAPLDGYLWVGTYDEEAGFTELTPTIPELVELVDGAAEFDVTAPGLAGSLVWMIGSSETLDGQALVLTPTVAVQSFSYDVNPKEAIVGVATTYTVTDNYGDPAADRDIKIVTPSIETVTRTTGPAGTPLAGKFNYTAPEVGDYYVSVKLDDATWQAPITVTVILPLESISAEPSEVSLLVGDEEQLAVTATYSDETTANVTAESTYESSDPLVATVSDTGLITGVAEGDATVTVSYTEAGITKTAEVSVTVSEEAPARKGDFDGDGDIDLADFVEFVAAYGSSTGDANYNVAGDFDDDGDIDLADFVAFVAVYGT